MREGGFSKKNRAELRKLQGVAWERELGVALQELESQFVAWRNGTINAFELSDGIHKFHDGENRELWKFYSNPRNPYAVPSAIAKGVLTESDVSKGLMEKIAKDVEHFRQVWNADKE